MSYLNFYEKFSKFCPTIFKSPEFENPLKFEFYMSQCIRLMRLIGFNTWEGSMTKLRFLYSIGALIVMFHLPFCLFFFVYENISDISLVVVSIGITGSANLTAFKMIVILYYRKDIRKLIDVIKNDFWRDVEENRSKRVILMNGSRRQTFLVSSYIFCFIVEGFLFFSIPLFSYSLPTLVLLPGLLYFLSRRS